MTLQISWSSWPWLLLLVVTVAVSNAAIAVVVVKMPARYFCDPATRDSTVRDRHPVLRWTIRIAKNLAGTVMILLGIFLSLPGVPGPGVLLVLLGVTLVNFPGKKRLERRLVGVPGVFHAVNRLRERFGQAPLVLDEAPIREP